MSLITFLELRQSVQTDENNEPVVNYNGTPEVLEVTEGVYSTSLEIEIASLISKCQSELTRAESRILLATKLASQLAKSEFVNPSHSPLKSYQLTPESEAMHAAMHTVLMTVMAERDEAHTQLVSTSVLHVHEMEQERKKVERLKKKIELLERFNTGNGRRSIFAGKDEILSLEQFNKEMIDDTDINLITMCRQLSIEISAKTETALEVVRLKESQKIEKEREQAKIQALEKELDMYKEKLKEEQQRCAKARKASLGWKQSFDEVMSQYDDKGEA